MTMTENPIPVTVLTEPLGPTLNSRNLQTRIESANSQERLFAYLFSDSTVGPAAFLSGTGTLESFLGPKQSDNEFVAARKEQELALLKTILGKNARYLSMSLAAVEGKLLHTDSDAANQITKSAYGVTLRLGTNVGGYYHLFASPSFGASNFGNAKGIDITHRISNKQ